jgi:hypothetical protein
VRSVHSNLFERSAEEPCHLRVAPKPVSQFVDRVDVRPPRLSQRLSNQAVRDARCLEERRNPLEDEQVPSEDQLTAPLVAERPRQYVDRRAQDPGLEASSCFGVSFSGSMNGFSTTTAEVLPSGRSTSSSAPRSACSIGTIA